jgi:hypothetical protein
MKVIDLLNKIAKGEATNETDFALKEDKKITTMNIFIEEYYLNTEVLNMEIEEKVRKIEPCDFDITKVFKDLDTVQVSQFTAGIVNKLDEIIDEVNKLKEEKLNEYNREDKNL